MTLKPGNFNVSGGKRLLLLARLVIVDSACLLELGLEHSHLLIQPLVLFVKVVLFLHERFCHGLVLRLQLLLFIEALDGVEVTHLELLLKHGVVLL